MPLFQNESTAVNEVPVLNGNLVEESVESLGTVNGEEGQIEKEVHAGDALKSVSQKNIGTVGKLEPDHDLEKDPSFNDASESIQGVRSTCTGKKGSDDNILSEKEKPNDLLEKEKPYSNETCADSSGEVEKCESEHQVDASELQVDKINCTTDKTDLSESHLEKSADRTITGENEMLVEPVHKPGDEAAEKTRNKDGKNSENTDTLEINGKNETPNIDTSMKQEVVNELSKSDVSTDIDRQDSKDLTIEKIHQEINDNTTENSDIDNVNDTTFRNIDKSTVDVDPVENNSSDADKEELKQDRSQNLSLKSTDLSKDEVLETEQSSVDKISLISEVDMEGIGDNPDNVPSEKLKSCENENKDLKTSFPEIRDKISHEMEICTEQTNPEGGSTMPIDSAEPASLNPPKQNIVSTADKNSKITLKNSSSRLKSKTLDEVLFKITTLAENENQQKAAAQVSEVSEPSALPKKPKARKSCAPVKPTSGSVIKPITSLTFNVKELEKQGLLDLPKAQKRKAFEPMKIKTERSNYEERHVPDSEAELVSLKSPVKSPGKSDIPFSKKSKLIRKKKGRRGAYRLPGEKSKRRNKKSDTQEKMQENIRRPGRNEKSSTVHSAQKSPVQNDPSRSETVLSPVSALEKTPNMEQCSNQKNILSSTKTNRSLPAQTPSSSLKKARKSMKSADSVRTIDSFFIGGNNSNQRSSKVCSISFDFSSPCLTIQTFKPFPNEPWFLHVCITNLLKTLWVKEKLLITSNFSFSHSVFNPF